MKNEAYLDLLSIGGLGEKRLVRLMDIFGPPEVIFSKSRAELEETGIGKKVASAISSYSRSGEVKKSLEVLKSLDARIITTEDAEYPQLLLNSPAPPPVLFVRGELRVEEKLVIAIVGTRRATGYGRAAAERLARELAARGVLIVSGAARGIDTLAHKGALAAGGRTLAVLGCGIDVVYPPENDRLLETITADGAVVSEYIPGTTPAPGLFPQRNRIIAWLSHGVVTVEAGPKSGALITARLAADGGRDVFSVPGGIFSHQSEGTNQLLKEGAKLVSSIDDVLEEYGTVLESGQDTREDATEGMALSADEKRIYRLLGPEPIHVDKIVDKLGIASASLHPILLNMELKGVIKQLPGMRFVKVL
ncbi:DNA-protecting protein DprA [candidate division WOR-3 bacterium]|uniref:DNA-protecting protein DprA n=1 Tax=candidate division WOR-3 bacterium TaxID=2052148 RepID=A0A9D5QDD3_UNCW3|nr:DNA-protecting protein DprA [candidate division WOR-3 bacterium]MBD3365504.1 DNA-protecting protein DprA [candidate division WOR-3 bacterium]